MKDAIIVAGGRGIRMGGAIPKQFMEIDGKPIVVHTLQRFIDYDPAVRLTLVLPEAHLATWKSMQKKFFDPIDIRTTAGGVSRTDSVRKGLGVLAEDSDFVAIHDAVRPFVAPAVIAASFESAAKHGSGVAAVPLKDSIRLLEKGNKSRHVARDQYRLVQTPQTFRTEWLKEAYLKNEGMEYSDDASLYEQAGYQVWLVEGTYLNIKITTPEDLITRYE